MRIPVLIGGKGDPGGGDDAWLVEKSADMPRAGYAVRFAPDPPKFGHIAGCSCCTLRGPAAEALSRMFCARATGTAPFFKRVMVLASPEGEAAVREALKNDVVTAARYELHKKELLF